MQAPTDAIEALERLHPQARLAWFPMHRQPGVDEINYGEFALIELVDRSKRQQLGDRFLYEEWTAPLFGRSYDSTRFVPVWLANFNKAEVFGGSFVVKVRRWMTNMKKRMVDSAKEKGREYESEVQDLAGELGEKMYSDAQKSTDRPPVIANKFITAEEKATLTDDSKGSLEDTFMGATEVCR